MTQHVGTGSAEREQHQRNAEWANGRGWRRGAHVAEQLEQIVFADHATHRVGGRPVETAGAEFVARVAPHSRVAVRAQASRPEVLTGREPVLSDLLGEPVDARRSVAIDRGRDVAQVVQEVRVRREGAPVENSARQVSGWTPL